MAIKTLGSAQKIKVGRESGNTTLIFLGLTKQFIWYTLAYMNNDEYFNM